MFDVEDYLITNPWCITSECWCIHVYMYMSQISGLPKTKTKLINTVAT